MLTLGDEIVVDTTQLAGEMQYHAPQQQLVAARSNDAAARSLALEWYAQQLMTKAAEDDGLLERKPGLALAARARGRQLVARVYAEEYASREQAPTDRELEQFYEMNSELCREPARMRIASIAVVVGRNASEQEREGAKARLARIEERLAAGEDFGKVADEVSDLPGRHPGGDLGWLTAEEASRFEGGGDLLALKTGDVKKVENPAYGYRVFKIVERTDADRKRLADCRDDVRKAIQERFRKETALRITDELAAQYQAAFNVDAFVAVVRSLQIQLPDAADPTAPAR